MLAVPHLAAPVSDAFAAFPEGQRRVLLDVRELVFAAAADDPRIGPLTESLKWGEPAYLTPRDRAPAIFVNCRSSLVAEIRDRCGDAFRYDGVGGIVLPNRLRRAADAVRHAAHLILTYHLWRSR